MKTSKILAIALAVLLFPVASFAQYRDLDTAMAGLSRGFERGEAQPVLQGISGGDKVKLSFPGLVSGDAGFFSRDQASYLLDELFNKTHPSGFQQVSARKVSAEGQYYITARWTIQVGGQPEARDLYITLRDRGADGYSIVRLETSGK